MLSTKRLGIVALKGHAKASQVAVRMKDLLTSGGLDAEIYETIEKLQGRVGAAGLPDDMLVVIGGDGTTLRSFLTMGTSPVPVLSVGIGRRNFLATTQHQAAEEAVERILSQDYSLETAVRLDVRVGRRRFHPVLNEVYLTSSSPGMIIDTRVAVAAEKGLRVIWRDLADGVMVATPIGSTAYSLSAGGPIMDTSLDSFTVTPVAPIIYKASIVVSGEDRVGLWADAKEDLALVFDGQSTETVRPRQRVIVRKSDSPATFVTFDEDPRVSRMIRAFRAKR
ncbi:MAG: NAD(+)/NADH kinase [Candidatus Geothermarchaeales archaeon]